VVEAITDEQYKNSYGITTIDNGIQLEFVKKHAYGTNFGSRVYLMDGTDSYKMFKLKNREFTMDFDVSEAPCGLNGAMYFVEMDKSGDYGGGNKAGAKYGTGYCDAQCPHDVKWIHGEANVKNWTKGDPSRGPSEGHYGACCQELDIWEANSMANAYTPHPCQKSGETLVGNYKCEGAECGDNGSGERYKGVCDKDGCDFNPYRMGNQSFFGKGKIIDTTKPITVVTQFITTDGTDDGDLSEMRRLYIQNGEIIKNSVATNVPGSYDSITDEFCDTQKETYGNPNEHKVKGGLAEMGRSLDRGHVMVMSVWDDPAVNMNWLDSAFPLDVPASNPGVERGACPGGVSSTPEYLRSKHGNARVSFSNAAVGEIGSTFAVDGPQPTPRPTPSPTPTPTPSPSPSAGGCYLSDCGCPPFSSGQSWCNANSAIMTGWCAESSGNCNNCNGVYCGSTSGFLARVARHHS
jgi:cellulose 1,4-beta-cellobiosidase